MMDMNLLSDLVEMNVLSDLVIPFPLIHVVQSPPLGAMAIGPIWGLFGLLPPIGGPTHQEISQ